MEGRVWSICDVMMCCSQSRAVVSNQHSEGNVVTILRWSFARNLELYGIGNSFRYKSSLPPRLARLDPRMFCKVNNGGAHSLWPEHSFLGWREGGVFHSTPIVLIVPRKGMARGWKEIGREKGRKDWKEGIFCVLSLLHVFHLLRLTFNLPS